MSQIVVLKGTCGFGDRLQVLSHCMEYCIINNATLCVDWRDPLWGQGTLDFSDYFEIIGIPTITLDKVIDKIKNGATIYPKKWTIDSLLDSNSKDHYTKECTVDICDFLYTVQHKEDILVDNCLNKRKWNITNLTKNLRIKSDLIPFIIDKLNCLKFPYTSIHLRGTDKNINPFDNTIKMYAELPKLCTETVYVLGDNKSLLTEWCNTYKNCILYEESSAICKLNESKLGTHTLSKDILTKYNITKHELNINTIYNFMIIVYSDWAIGHTTSYYWLMARRLHDTNIDNYSKWLDGYIPDGYSPSNYKHKINYKENNNKRKHYYYRMRSQ
jgi:hypothetical protein